MSEESAGEVWEVVVRLRTERGAMNEETIRRHLTGLQEGVVTGVEVERLSRVAGEAWVGECTCAECFDARMFNAAAPHAGILTEQPASTAQ